MNVLWENGQSAVLSRVYATQHVCVSALRNTIEKDISVFFDGFMLPTASYGSV